MATDWRWRAFDALTARELHDILKLRCDVFVVEQACAFPEIDGRDPEAHHLMGFEASGLAGCLRLFGPSAEEPAWRIGRIAVGPGQRGTGLGHRMMAEALRFAAEGSPGHAIVLSAQSRLEAFYARHGFEAEGLPYLEDGIEHVDMRRPGHTGLT
ncbi:ElaA protein [Aureimonas endophytica]|uniref:ElaA protein n=1 Tax=Aureimonas endophytica TaxID=2027858 RepID=A0A916ZIP8_9HYPH|nr:GNAT family N-acetyltransferase [Aureimonas endophytica]GGE00135.1 ElaA protein [Aureimonas endophytica]